MDTVLQKRSGVRMPEIGIAHKGQIVHPSNEACKLMSEALWLQRLPVSSRAHQVILGLPNAERQQLLRLLAVPPSQLGDREGRENDGPVPIRLRRLKADAAFSFGLLKALHNTQCTALKIDVFPSH